MLNDTICAISTPLGKGGIGIVRISGRDAFAVAKRLFVPARHPPGEQEPQSHRLYYGYIRSPGQDDTIDEVLVAFMRAPHTYTREDVVEINAHSGFACLNAILQRMVAEGVRQAKPGEFTQRAFLNGRIDLNQVEGVIDTINAESTRQLRSAQKLLGGLFSSALEKIQVRLEEIIADMEAVLEFGDQVTESTSGPMTWRRHIRDDLLAPINALMVRGTGRPADDDPVAVLAGSPNVGKSSLMNRLARSERSIVTQWPGTTRDTVNARVRIDGCDMEMVDTAGLHADPEPIEQIGIQRAREAIAKADVVVHVLDEKQGARLAEEAGEFRMDGDMPDTNGKRGVVVVNKSDLLSQVQREQLPEQWHGRPVVAASALNGEGLDAVEGALAEAARQVAAEKDNAEGEYVTVRQAHHLERVGAALQAAVDAIGRKMSEDLIVIDLKNAAAELQRMMGRSVTADVLDAVFERFCVGK